MYISGRFFQNVLLFGLSVILFLGLLWRLEKTETGTIPHRLLGAVLDVLGVVGGFYILMPLLQRIFPQSDVLSQGLGIVIATFGWSLVLSSLKQIKHPWQQYLLAVFGCFILSFGIYSAIQWFLVL
jgi:uncharacterized protein YacL